MTIEELLTLIESQPSNRWTTGTMYNGHGHYCAIGWAAHKKGMKAKDLKIIEDYDTVAEFLGIDPALLWACLAENDVAGSQRQAAQRIRTALQ